jgi:GNAT superfamily N-acetyltransferase
MRPKRTLARVPSRVSIRDGLPSEVEALEALQRRSSDVWEEFRAQLAAHPDAIELPRAYAEHGWVRVAVGHDETVLGFSVVLPGERGKGGVDELDGLFVEPASMFGGVGRALVEDAAARAARAGAVALEVTAGPAQGFYENVGFSVCGITETRFAPAVRMRRAL